MRIRFLQTVASENPHVPFQAGQVIDVSAPSDYLLSLLDGARAEAVPTDETERAIEPELQRSEPRRKRRRSRHAVD